jgi:hypothetical protein
MDGAEEEPGIPSGEEPAQAAEMNNTAATRIPRARRLCSRTGLTPSGGGSNPATIVRNLPSVIRDGRGGRRGSQACDALLGPLLLHIP